MALHSSLILICGKSGCFGFNLLNWISTDVTQQPIWWRHTSQFSMTSHDKGFADVITKNIDDIKDHKTWWHHTTVVCWRDVSHILVTSPQTRHGDDVTQPVEKTWPSYQAVLQVWPQSGSKCPKMGKVRDFSDQISVHFEVEPNWHAWYYVFQELSIWNVLEPSKSK